MIMRCTWEALEIWSVSFKHAGEVFLVLGAANTKAAVMDNTMTFSLQTGKFEKKKKEKEKLLLKMFQKLCR